LGLPDMERLHRKDLDSERF